MGQAFRSDRSAITPAPESMAAWVMSYAPASDAEALKLLRGRFPDCPLSLRVAADKTCADVRDLAVAKLTDVDRKLGELARMRAALASLAASCTGEGPTAECPLLDALDVQGGSDGDR